MMCKENYTVSAWGELYPPAIIIIHSTNIEICVNPDSNYDKTRLNCVDLVWHLIQETEIPIDRVIRHYDAKRKWCPRKMMDKSGVMDKLLPPDPGPGGRCEEF